MRDLNEADDLCLHTVLILHTVMVLRRTRSCNPRSANSIDPGRTAHRLGCAASGPGSDPRRPKARDRKAPGFLVFWAGSGGGGCRRGQAGVALAQAGQARIRLAVTGLEVRLATTADVHLRARHQRADTGLGTGPGCRVLCLSLSKLHRRIRSGGGRGAACGHGAVNPKCKTQRWGRWMPLSTRYCPSIPQHPRKRLHKPAIKADAAAGQNARVAACADP